MQLAHSSSPAILLVDDDPTMLQILICFMHKHWATVDIVAVSDGTHALDQLAQRLIPLLVTDYNLPGMSGLQLARFAKIQRPGTQVVLISGEALDADILGVDYYLPKPFSLSDLQQIVDIVLH
jgi:two-component system, response regulator, stage 0 sporulation protein F